MASIVIINNAENIFSINEEVFDNSLFEDNPNIKKLTGKQFYRKYKAALEFISSSPYDDYDSMYLLNDTMDEQLKQDNFI